MIEQLIKKSRSYRRFYGDEKIEKDTLLNLVDYARLSPSGANKQPLKYFVSCDEETNQKIYPNLSWAGYLPEWPGPEPGERPTGYIIILQDKEYKMVAGVDHGIAAQSILLGAVEKDLGGCIVAAINRDQLKKDLNIPDNYEVLLVIALGKPKEKVVIDEIDDDQDIKYWRDNDMVHHVPKRKLESIILNY